MNSKETLIGLAIAALLVGSLWVLPNPDRSPDMLVQNSSQWRCKKSKKKEQPVCPQWDLTKYKVLYKHYFRCEDGPLGYYVDPIPAPRWLGEPRPAMIPSRHCIIKTMKFLDVR